MKVRWGSTIPFWGCHIFAIGGIAWWGWSWTGFLIAMAFYYIRMFGITAGYHRYFSHRSYKTGRIFQFFMALLGTLAVQKGVLWWAAHHRAHHKHSDTPEDIHSPRLKGFWWSHFGWILVDKFEPTDWARIKDFAIPRTAFFKPI
jgi:stearoyl-CoA desaturase (delta-9 desaturase)